MAIKEKNLAGGIKWIDVTDPSAGEMEQLSATYHLNQHTVKDCLMPEHLPKYEFDEDTQVHFLILRFYTHTTDRHPDSIQELTNKIAIFYTDRMLITIHKNTAPFLDLIARQEEKKSSSETTLMVRIIWQALETFDDPANRLSEQLDFHESKVMLKKSGHDVTESLFYLKRQASLSLKVLMLMLEPINHIRVADGEEALLQDTRDQHLKMQTLYGQILEEVNNLLTISMSFAAQRTNEVVRVLTLFSVFFMPLTFIAGIYGMNFDFMPELRQPWGYPVVLLLMGAITFVIYRWFKRKKWL
ncbi:MAG: CorA family divalent cation transporter [Chitinophagaceae bacterium]